MLFNFFIKLTVERPNLGEEALKRPNLGKKPKRP
jgi:hypothetical protein